MSAEKLSERAEGVRLAEAEARWITAWVKDTGNNRSLPIRAGVRLLRLIVEGMDYEPRVRLVTYLARNETSPDDETEFWAAIAAKATQQGGLGRGRGPGPSTGRKKPGGAGA